MGNVVKKTGIILQFQCGSRNQISQKKHHTQLVEYDAYMRQEEMKYSQLLEELKHTRWFIQNEDPTTAFFHIHDKKHEDLLSEHEVTRLNSDEISNGSASTMDQVLAMNSKRMKSLDDESREKSISHCAMILFPTVSPHQNQKTLSLNKVCIGSLGMNVHDLSVGLNIESSTIGNEDKIT